MRSKEWLRAEQRVMACPKGGLGNKERLHATARGCSLQCKWCAACCEVGYGGALPHTGTLMLPIMGARPLHTPCGRP